MGTLTTGNIKAGALESSDSPAPNTYVSFANTTVITYDSTAYTAGGQEIETFDFTENGLSTGEAFVYEKSGAGKLQGYPGLCVVSDQPNGSQVFVDRGPSKHQITVAGHTHHDSGGGIYLNNPTSIYFDGTGDYLSLLASPDWAMGTGPFTVEVWIHFSAVSANQFIIGTTSGTNNDFDLYVDCTGGDQGPVLYLNDTAYRAAVTPVATTWTHIAVQRDSSQYLSFYWNGKLIKKALTAAQNIAAHPFGIGQQWNSGDLFTGYLDDFRIIKGVALYTHDFSPPSRSPKDLRAYGDVADYTKITMMGYRSDSSSYFTAINYVAGNEVVARDYMGIGYDDLKSVAYSGSTQKIMVYNNTTNTVKFTAYVEATT